MDPFIGEIRMFGGNYAPYHWSLCLGQLLPISQFQLLAGLLGTTYGGDGRVNFNLPDLLGRVPMGDGHGINLTPRFQGTMLGTETETITENTMPKHRHNFLASTDKSLHVDPTQMV